MHDQLPYGYFGAAAVGLVKRPEKITFGEMGEMGRVIDRGSIGAGGLTTVYTKSPSATAVALRVINNH
jgi:hypothetical protein